MSYFSCINDYNKAHVVELAKTGKSVVMVITDSGFVVFLFFFLLETLVMLLIIGV